MPAMTMVHMTPIATIATTGVCRIRLLMLPSVRKLGVVSASATQSATVKAMT
jgi:hypothetical protein